MPKDLTRENVLTGDVVYAWEINEYEQYDRGVWWYVLMGGLGLALLATALLTNNYLFALVIVLFAIILYLHEMQTPLSVPFTITTIGIALGRKFYRFSELKNFWIIYQPGQAQNLYFSLGGAINHRLQIPLLDTDPLAIRDFLLQYLREDLSQEEEPAADRFARVLKLH